MNPGDRVKLPEAVAKIYEAVKELKPPCPPNAIGIGSSPDGRFQIGLFGVGLWQIDTAIAAYVLPSA